MILRFMGVLSRFEAKLLKICSEVGQWFFLKESGQIDGSVRQQLAPAKTDKKRVVFVSEFFKISSRDCPLKLIPG